MTAAALPDPVCVVCLGPVVRTPGSRGPLGLTCSDACRSKRESRQKRERYMRLGRSRSCSVCGDSLPKSDRWARCCSDACRAGAVLAYRRAAAAKRRAEIAARPPGKCHECGSTYPMDNARRRYCSVRCRRRRTWRAASASRRARVAGAAVESVDHMAVFRRDGWVCQMCRCRVSHRANRGADDKATIDHILPLASGGDHSYANIQTACWKCNREKGARSAGQSRPS